MKRVFRSGGAGVIIAQDQGKELHDISLYPELEAGRTLVAKLVRVVETG